MGKEVVDAEELRKELKATFRGAVRTVSEKDDFDFVVIPQVIQDEPGGGVLLATFPSETKEFRLIVKSIDKQGDQWLVETPQQIWSFRQVPDDVRKKFITGMRKAGIGG